MAIALHAVNMLSIVVLGVHCEFTKLTVFPEKSYLPNSSIPASGHCSHTSSWWDHFRELTYLNKLTLTAPQEEPGLKQPE
jgi:hypothetical protein